MRGSFQDQLLKLGLVEKQKAQDTKKEQYQSRKQQTGKEQSRKLDANAILAEAAQQKKRERAQQLNLEREEKLRKREDEARITQLIESHRLPQDAQGVPYRFADRGKIFRIFVSAATLAELSTGKAAIVRLGEKYEVIDRDAAEKIIESRPGIIVHRVSAGAHEKSGAEDDPYKGYEIPDDLTW